VFRRCVGRAAVSRTAAAERLHGSQCQLQRQVLVVALPWFPPAMIANRFRTRSI